MKRALFVIMAITLLFGCQGKWFQISPQTDAAAYETLGRDVGAYLKAKKPEIVKDAQPWVDGALLLSDAEILNQDVLQTMYEYLLKENPENADIILLTKSTLVILGVKINLNASELLPEDKPKYIECVRGLLKGYSEVVK